jgi:hypothetical protein
MNVNYNYFLSLVILLLLFTFCSCSKSSEHEDEGRVLLKVNANESIKDREEWCYLAAFSPQGELLGLACLSDSVNWEMKVPTYTGDKIDILTYEINDFEYVSSGQIEGITDKVNVTHYQDIDVGSVFDMSMSYTQKNLAVKPLFSDGNISQFDERELNIKSTKVGIPHYGITLKVEDFGTDPLVQQRNKSDEPVIDNWKYKNDGAYFYWDTHIRSDSLAYDGLRLSVTDKLTLEPYVYYGELLGAGFKRNDTLVLHKSDFVKGEINNIEIVDENNTYRDYNSATFNAYNTTDGKVDLLCKGDRYYYSESFLEGINCLVSENLKINKWNFSYSTRGSQCYFASHSELPNEIRIKKISNLSVSTTTYGKRWYLKHGYVNTSLSMGISQCVFYGSFEGFESVNYTFCINGDDSLGVSDLTAFKIPDQIINDMQLSPEFQSLQLVRTSYKQYYYDNTDISSINFLKAWMNIESVYSNEKEIYAR